MKYFNSKGLRFSLINSLFALILFVISQAIYFLPGEDSKVFFYGPVIKEYIFGNEIDSNEQRFLFINTNYDNMLVNNLDEYGFPMGNIVISDREKLNELFLKFNKHQLHEYILCDVFFENSSPFDKDLSKTISKLNNFIIPRKDSLRKMLPDFRYGNLGLGSVIVSGDIFYKYRMFSSSINGKSVPLKMYEKLNTVQYKSFGVFGILDEKLVFNDFVPDLQINNYDIYENEKYPLYNLGDVLQLKKDSFRSLVKDKIVVIGNYDTDVHQSIYGEISGPLILVNAFLALEKSANVISVGLVFFLLIIFFMFSYFVQSEQKKTKNFFSKIPVFGVLITTMSYFLVMTLISAIVYFIFGNNLNFTLVAVLFFLERVVIKLKLTRKQIKLYFIQVLAKSKNLFLK